jgi:RimJ/RimL family protein N-acetyltransferase
MPDPVAPLRLHLLDIAACDAVAADPAAALPGLDLSAGRDLLPGIAEAIAAMLRATGAAPPWTGYLAAQGDAAVGTCAFKAPPGGGEVEIAYFTFPGHENRGIARAMAAALARIAFAAPEVARVVACTLPGPNASAALLARLGFARDGGVLDPEAGPAWRWVLHRPG